MSDLRSVIRIKTMAEAAASVSEQPGPDEGAEMAAAYERLRQEARELNTRAGWGEGESFDAELPPLELPEAPGTLVARITEADIDDQRATAGRRARVLLGQLAAWAAGHQEAFEIEERLKAEAQVRGAAGAPKPPTGFR